MQKNTAQKPYRIPRETGDKEKEEEYIQQLKKLADKRESEEPGEKIDAGGFLVSKKLLNRADSKNCISCGKYFFKREDDIYMSKFECCHKCYVHNIETKQNLKEMKNAQK